jgi:hypothetical protein
MSFDPQLVNNTDWSSISPEEKKSIESWLEHFDAKYMRVGRLNEWLNPPAVSVSARPVPLEQDPTKLLSLGWTQQDLHQLQRLLQTPGVEGHFVLRSMQEGRPPVFMWDAKFQSLIMQRIQTTGLPVGPAPGLPHSDIVPERLLKYHRALATIQETLSRTLAEPGNISGISNATIPSQSISEALVMPPAEVVTTICSETERQLQVCLDSCFWAPQEIDNARHVRKQCSRGCVDAALNQLRALQPLEP